MKQTLLIVCAFALFSSAFAQTCNGTIFGAILAPECTDSTKPYCRNTGAPTDVTPTYTCVACKSHCDCGLSEYCSTDPSLGVGTCQSFTPTCDAQGCQCRQLTQSQLESSAFPDNTKCGVVWTYVNAGVTVYVADVVGACIDGDCHICSSSNSNSPPILGTCNFLTGTQGYKACSDGGNFMSAYAIQWAPSNYQQNVDGVWFAIFFVFFVISIGIQIGHCCVQMRK